MLLVLLMFRNTHVFLFLLNKKAIKYKSDNYIKWALIKKMWSYISPIYKFLHIQLTFAPLISDSPNQRRWGTAALPTSVEEWGPPALPPGEIGAGYGCHSRTCGGAFCSWPLGASVRGFHWSSHLVCDRPLQTLVRTMNEAL